MAQHDYLIDNQTAAALRTDLNNALAAIVSNNSGATAPTTTFANMLWYDTSTSTLWVRNEADSAWISLGIVDQPSGVFRPSLSGLTFSAGDLIYSDGTNYQRLPKGSAGQFLRQNSGLTAPYWAEPDLFAAGYITAGSSLVWSAGVASAGWISTGVLQITFAAARSSTNYVPLLTHQGTGSGVTYTVDGSTVPTTTAVFIRGFSGSTPTNLNTHFAILEKKL